GMRKDDVVIVTCAITGAIHTPSMSPYLPVTPDQIVEEAVKAAEAGAGMVHIHARDPKDGRPTTDVEVFRYICREIKKQSDVVINVTTGGGGTLGIPVEERAKVVPALKPEIATFNMGSMNFAIHPLLKKYKEFKYDWEPEYLEMTRDIVFRNTFKDLEALSRIFKENDTKPELECYDIGQIYNTAFMFHEGYLEPPLRLQFIHGILGGIGTAVEDVLFMKQTADRLIGRENYTWSLVGAGRFQMPLGTLAVIMGGDVRVGLEDSLYIERGKLAKSNAEQVEKMVRIVKELGKRPATPDEVREILGLKGKERVNF
uniref:uncharacterized protein n=1 Tax=Archaeoglobus fulgidus TaxID=2234 RepID=UPI0001C4E299